jgi:hypothetical protein
VLWPKSVVLSNSITGITNLRQHKKNVVEVFAIAMVSARRIISARGPASIVAANWRSPQTSAFRSQISPIP